MNRINKLLLGLSLLIPALTFADPSITGPHVVMQTDGSQADGAANIVTNNAGPIRFYTNKTLRSYVDGTTGAWTGMTLTSPTITGTISVGALAGASPITVSPGTDANRLFSFGASSDAAHTLTFGDAGVTATQSLFIGASTPDGDDDSVVSIGGGGAKNNAQGSYIEFRGNEASSGGQLQLVAGDKTSGAVYIDTVNASGTINFRSGAQLQRWQVGTAGELTQDATNGGNIVMPKVTSTILKGLAALDSDITALTGATPGFVSVGDSDVGAQFLTENINADSTGNEWNAYKTRSTTGDANTIVSSGDTILKLRGVAADGASFRYAASIEFAVDGTPGASDMPGNIIFKTTPDGSATLAQALKIGNDTNAVFSGTITSSRTTDGGWAFVDATDNQACNTGCTSACAFGIANATGTAVTALVGCADATADSCICMGAS